MDGNAGSIRVLIVDDHQMVRQGLRTFLELQDDAGSLAIRVVGEAADGAQAVHIARECQPDIVLLDLVMPKMDGIQATPRILQASPRSRVIILTSFGEEHQVMPAIRAGAQGYLLKDISPQALVQAIREVVGEVTVPVRMRKPAPRAICWAPRAGTISSRNESHGRIPPR